MAQTFGMIVEYGQLKGKTDKETAAATKQSEENKGGSIEPEANKPRVKELNPSGSTTNESGTPTT
jgi:hypothetical protein